jgi:hypothetical protein
MASPLKVELEPSGQDDLLEPTTRSVAVQQLNKSLKRKLNGQSMLAHEEELRRALAPLAEAFDRWRKGELDSGSLALQIHDWDLGPQKELFKNSR